MDILFFIGRILYGGYFVMSGVNHFRYKEMMISYMQSKNVPMQGFLNAVSGLLLLIGGLGILLGVYIQAAVACLVLFLVPVTFKMHNFWKETDQNMKMISMQMFLKNMVMLGAALMLLSVPQPWAFALF